MTIELPFCPHVKDLIKALTELNDLDAPVLIESQKSEGGIVVDGIEYIKDVPLTDDFAKTQEKKTVNVVILKMRKHTKNQKP